MNHMDRQEQGHRFELVRDVLESAPDAMVVVDEDGAIMLVNGQVEELFGYPRDELIGEPVELLMPERFRAAHPGHRAGFIGTPDVRPMGTGLELMARRKNGSEFLVEISLSPVRTPTGTTVAAAIRDISERKRAEKSLRAARDERAKVNELMDHFFEPEMFVIAGFDGHFQQVNPRCEEILGYSSEELTGRPFMDFVHPDDVAATEAQYSTLQGGSEAIAFENRYRRRDGSYVSLSWNAIPSVKHGLIYAIAHDVTEPRRAEAEIARFAAVVSSTEDAILTKDRDLTITSWNQGAEKLYGYEAAEVIGKHVEILIPTERAGEDALILRRVLAGEHVEHFDCQRVRKDGRLIDLSLTVSAIRDPSGAIAGASSIARDISQRKAAEEALEQARVAAEEASRMKSEFVANMSHEIRTPLNGVVGMTELVLHTDLDEDQRECLDAIRTSGHALMKVIDDILDFSKIEAGGLELDHSDFDLRRMVDDVLAMVASTANEKQLEVVARVDSEVPTMLRSDGNRIRQVLANLVNNAVKFTSQGEVVIRVAAVDSGAGSVLLRFEVSDTGIGMEPALIGRVFESFVQADASVTREYGGTGLGLTISRRLVELLGGEIGASSSRGEGSTFWFTVPCQLGADIQVSRPPLDTDGLRVLVVDDNEIKRAVLDYQLRSWNMTCEQAGDAEHALELMQAAVAEGKPYTLALLDYQMPGMDGLGLAAKIKATPQLRATHLLMLTCARTQEKACRDAGIEGLMTNPVRQSSLYDAIAQALGVDRRRARRSTPADIEDSARGRGELILVAEDTRSNETVAVRMLQRLGYRVDVARDGGEAVAMSNRSDYAGIFMDCQMPGLDGYSATLEIRRREGRRSHVPIIAMTAHTMPGDREKCLAAGMDDYIGKPLQMGTTAEVVARTIRRARAPETSRAPAEQPIRRPKGARSGAAGGHLRQ